MCFSDHKFPLSEIKNTIDDNSLGLFSFLWHYTFLEDCICYRSVCKVEQLTFALQLLIVVEEEVA